MLTHNGRLVFFLPTVTDEYEEVDIHSMMCDGMEVISNSLQDFGSWGRRVRHFLYLQSLTSGMTDSLKIAAGDWF
jgi:hypothetical protein